MLLDEARRLAHARGVEYCPAGNVQEGLYDQVDVADLIYQVLEETHPPSSRPNARYDGQAYEDWRFEQEGIRTAVWEAFDDGLHGRALPVPVPEHSDAA